VAAEAGLHRWRTRNVGPIQRGLRTASARGCFTCHGPGGVTGLPDAGPGIGGVPPFSREEVRSYAHDEDEIRQWILDGAPRRLREEAGAPEGPPPLLRMPAWRGVVSDREVGDLVAYVKAVSDFDLPPEGPIDEGRRVAAKRGCLSCHGPQGRGNAPNPGSLKGYIPSWDGADFPELAQDQAEIREWILDGSPRRLRESRLAMFFLRRQVLQMPGYRGRLRDDEVARLLDYIRWLRRRS
jgi:mono/diheme cytochrome c family protein